MEPGTIQRARCLSKTLLTYDHVDLNGEFLACESLTIDYKREALQVYGIILEARQFPHLKTLSISAAVALRVYLSLLYHVKHLIVDTAFYKRDKLLQLANHLPQTYEIEITMNLNNAHDEIKLDDFLLKDHVDHFCQTSVFPFTPFVTEDFPRLKSFHMSKRANLDQALLDHFPNLVHLSCSWQNCTADFWTWLSVTGCQLTLCTFYPISKIEKIRFYRLLYRLSTLKRRQFKSIWPRVQSHFFSNNKEEITVTFTNVQNLLYNSFS